MPGAGAIGVPESAPPEAERSGERSQAEIPAKSLPSGFLGACKSHGHTVVALASERVVAPFKAPARWAQNVQVLWA